jgi:hypothetical protein
MNFIKPKYLFNAFIIASTICIADAYAEGPLRVSPINPRYFTDNSGNAIYLTGSHTWSNFQDNGRNNPPPVFNWERYLDWMKWLNHNFIRLWIWEESRWTSETTDANYWFFPQTPYKRKGPGTALDGNQKWNLDSLDDLYFARLRQRCIDAGNKGIYVSIMLFNGWSIYNRGSLNTPFKGCPFNISNNINFVSGDPNGDGNGDETHSLSIPAVTAYQYRYIKRVVDAVNDLDNVLFEISNESPYTGSKAWQNNLIDTIHSYELRKPKQHPVGYTGDWAILNNDLFASHADWISPAAGTNGNDYKSNPPASDGTKVIIIDTDHLWGIGGDRKWVWKCFTRGHNPIFMDGYDGASYGCGGSGFDSTLSWVQSLRKNLGYTRNYATKMNLLKMTPQDNLSSTTYCLANTSSAEAEYLIYNPNSGQFRVDLTPVSGTLYIEWFNPEDGSILQAGTTEGGSNKNFTPPFSGDAVLYLHRASNLSILPESFRTNFEIYQNYPNPSNPSTVISYYLPVESHVILKIFDITGRELAKLVDTQMQAGLHKTTCNLEGTSGIYFYRIDAAPVVNPGKHFIAVKKIVLIK